MLSSSSSWARCPSVANTAKPAMKLKRLLEMAMTLSSTTKGCKRGTGCKVRHEMTRCGKSPIANTRAARSPRPRPLSHQLLRKTGSPGLQCEPYAVMIPKVMPVLKKTCATAGDGAAKRDGRMRRGRARARKSAWLHHDRLTSGPNLGSLCEHVPIGLEILVYPGLRPVQGDRPPEEYEKQHDGETLAGTVDQ